MKEVIKAANWHEIDGSEQELLKMWFVAWFECSVWLREAGLKKAGK
jgi:hypothetical protein